jgi:type I restriction enzyme S subunit
MNSGLVIAHFDHTSDAPDAIPRLRSFILDLAVRGKLVGQNAKDEPASELLKRIHAENLRLKGRERGKPSSEPEVRPGELPFLAPTGWSWARLADISYRIHYGFTASADRSRKGVRLLRITDIQNNLVDWSSVPGCEISEREIDQYKLRPGDILIARTGGTIGKTFLVDKIPVVAVFASYLIRVQKSPEFCDRYLKLFLESPVYWKQLRDGSRGGGQPNVNGQTLSKMFVPVPPVAEQNRIVDKVDELMSLCDRLERAHKKGEDCRDQLAALALRNLNNGQDSESFRSHADFYISHVPVLCSRPSHVNQLRRTILNLAVRGRLAEQCSTDGPASELLRWQQKDKERLVKEGKTKERMQLPDLNQDLAPFSIPSGWRWEFFANVAVIQSNLVDPDKYQDWAHIAPDNIETATGKLLPYTTIGLAGVFSAKHLFSSGCILYSKIRPALAKVVVVDFEGLCSADMYPITALINREYLHKFMLSDVFVRQSVSEDNRVAMPKINQIALSKIMVPVPPLAEQGRIVARVDELMAICDRLEAQLTIAVSEKRGLLESVLFHALNDRDELPKRSGRPEGLQMGVV